MMVATTSTLMNNLYFSCTQCRVFVDAGYRWAYWTLEEPGIVQRGEAVRADLVLGTSDYWNPEPDKQSTWLLQEVLPSVREFLTHHDSHQIVFDEGDVIHNSGSEWFLEWIQEGYLADPLPRFCLERLNLKSWAQVSEYIGRLKFKPAWWMDLEERSRAERWYNARLISGLKGSQS